jgi:zinc and cadmium transporter
MLFQVILFSFLGGVVSLFGATLMLVWRKKLDNLMGELTSFAAGVLMTIAVLDLLPEALGLGETREVVWALFGGILFLFLMEKTSLWFHHHHEPHGKAPSIVGVWLSDTIHNFIDGLAIGGAFVIGTPMGIATAVAVGLHELPTEMADFSLYLKAGKSTKTTLVMNFVSSLVTVIGAVLIFILGSSFSGWEGPLLAFTAGMFLYIALADLIPDLHHEESKKRSLIQLLIFFLGMGLAFMSFSLLE